MADINTYLAQILSATYGEEVRGAIHDSINAMNVESTQAMQDASVAQDSAAQSALAASSSASSASSSASSASSSASSASSSASSALSSKNVAESAKNEAESLALAAKTSEINAKQAANDAEDAKNSVDDKVTDVMTLKFNLMMDHSICQDLIDSNDGNLLDSNGNNLFGQVLFADSNDIISLKKNISDLETIINRLMSLLISSRLTAVETNIADANEAIARLNQHALLDSTF